MTQGLFSTVSEEYYQNYTKIGFIERNDNLGEKIFYQFLFILFIIISVTSLTLFYKLRNVYIIHHRNFILTFIGGIVTCLNVIIGLLPQLFLTHCLLNVFQANILNTIVILIFISRSLRVILYYQYNIYKVTSIKKTLSRRPNKSIEPNFYLPKILKKINKIITLFITIPTLLAFIATLIIYICVPTIKEECPITGREDALIKIKNNDGKELFYVVMFYSGLYMIFCIIISIALFYVKDVNKYGVKFECLTISILIVIFNIINILLQKGASSGGFFTQNGRHFKIYLLLFEKTKGGKILFTFLSMYMFIVSITLPVIQYYLIKRKKNNTFQDSTNSIQYFYKVLNTPFLVNELRDIAIKEFSVENILFWENYQILQTMVYRYSIEYNKAKEKGDIGLVSQFDFESFFQKQLISFSSSSMENYSYEPNMPIPKEIMPYYTSFYYMFIDINGPAVVNLTNNTYKSIVKNMSICPTVGMYDDAKNEIVEIMFSSIFPILLRKNKKHMPGN